MHGIYMYEVSAGVTTSQGQSEDALYNEAKGNLDAFLKGLSITDAARKIVRPALRQAQGAGFRAPVCVEPFAFAQGRLVEP